MVDRVLFTIDGYRIWAELPASLSVAAVRAAAPVESLPLTQRGFEEWLAARLLDYTSRVYRVDEVPGHTVRIIDA